jgi:uncharacterized protein (TIGR02246 family)
MTAKGPTTKTATLTNADMAAIKAVPMRIVSAWGKQDAVAFSKVFTEDGSMILPGVYKKGRSEILSFMADAFVGPYRGTQVTGVPIDFLSLGDQSAVLVTEGGVLAPGEVEVPPERAIRATWVVLKRDGEWRLAAYQNSPK